MATRRDRAGVEPFEQRYVRVLGALLALQALSGALFKIAQGRPDDLAHTAVHLVSAVVALGASLPRCPLAAARTFATGFGAVYLALGVAGHLQAPALGALHLEIADHLFHVAVGLATLVVGLRGVGARARPGATLRRSR